MDNNQDDVYAARRAELEAQFQALPPTGSSDYWRRIEESDAERRLPLEVLARCCRERYAAGVTDDANRIFNGHCGADTHTCYPVGRVNRSPGEIGHEAATPARDGAGVLHEALGGSGK